MYEALYLDLANLSHAFSKSDEHACRVPLCGGHQGENPSPQGERGVFPPLMTRASRNRFLRAAGIVGAGQYVHGTGVSR